MREFEMLDVCLLPPQNPLEDHRVIGTFINPTTSFKRENELQIELTVAGYPDQSKLVWLQCLLDSEVNQYNVVFNLHPLDNIATIGHKIKLRQSNIRFKRVRPLFKPNHTLYEGYAHNGYVFELKRAAKYLIVVNCAKKSEFQQSDSLTLCNFMVRAFGSDISLRHLL